jgi:hypothetical protein
MLFSTFKFILNKESMIDADDTIFEANIQPNHLNFNISWKEENGYNNVNYSKDEVCNNIDEGIWIIIP